MVSTRLTVRRIFWSLPFFIVLALWGVFRHGVELDYFAVAGFKVEKLYLKLDKRLLLKARKVVIPRQHGEAGAAALQRGLGRLHRLLNFFDEIDLEEVDFVDKHYRVLYRDRILYIKSSEFEVAGMVYNRGKEMEVQFPLVRIPRYDVTLSGELYYRYGDGRIEATGFYQVPNLSGEFRIVKEGERIRFRIESMRTGSLKRLIGLFTMSREAREWLSRRISAESYRLVNLEGTGRYDEKSGKFLPDIQTVHGTVSLKKVRIRFHDALLPLTAPAARVVMQGGNLYFFLDHPRYGRKSLEGSQAALLHLNEPDRLKLLLRLYYRGRLDSGILKILHTYGIPVMLTQDSGSSRIRVDIDIALKSGKVTIRGIARLTRGTVVVQKVPVRIAGGEVAFTSRRLQFRSVRIEEPFFRGELDGDCDLTTQRAKLKIRVDRLNIGPKDHSVVKMHKLTLPVDLKWDAKGYRLVFPTLRSRLVLNRSGDFRFRIDKLSLWHPYLAGVAAFAKEGNLKITGAKGGNYRVHGTLIWPDSPFYTRRKRIERFPFTAKIIGKALRFDALDGKISFRDDQKVLRIDSLNVNAQRLLEIVSRSGKDKKEGFNGGHYTVLGRKSVIRYGRYVLLSDTYRLDLNEDRIRFEGTLGEDHVWLEKRGEQLRVEAKRIGDRMLHSLIHFNGLQGGRYTLHLEGSEVRGYTGEILIDGGVLKDVKAYNDMIALFNTVPALVTFSNPGFSPKGFELKKGRILFTLKGDRLDLESILLEGRSATVAGKGWVGLADKRLDVELAVRTAREVGKTIGAIPVVGYILFGKDKSLTAGVKITGTLEKPVVRTNPVAEALLYPLELLKRTLMAPMELGQEDDGGSSNDGKRQEKGENNSTRQ